MKTVKELKEIIKNLPDETPIMQMDAELGLIETVNIQISNTEKHQQILIFDID